MNCGNLGVLAHRKIRGPIATPALRKGRADVHQPLFIDSRAYRAPLREAGLGLVVAAQTYVQRPTHELHWKLAPMRGDGGVLVAHRDSLEKYAAAL